MSRSCPRCASVFDAGLVVCPDDGALLIAPGDPEDPAPLLGRVLGGYVLVAEAAQGSMGRVYEGRDPATLDVVAIKVLHEEIARDAICVERFRREYETLRRIDHPNVLEALAFGETDDGSYFIAMEHLTGEELAHVLSREGALKPARTVRLVCQLALALDRAHAEGFVHRDLKPENIFVRRTDEGDYVKVLDFGVVKFKDAAGPALTAFGTALGSPCYMSPEQAMGKQDVDERTDVFAVAAIMHELATGVICFDGSSVAEIMMSIVRSHPPLAHLSNSRYPSAYGDVVNRALSKDRRKRPSSMLELAREMLAAFGLEEDVQGWAMTPEPYIASALAGDRGVAGLEDTVEAQEFEREEGSSAPRRTVATHETTQAISLDSEDPKSKYTVWTGVGVVVGSAALAVWAACYL